MNFHNARKQKTIQSPFENIRCKPDPENFHKKSLSIIQIQEPKTPYK